MGLGQWIIIIILVAIIIFGFSAVIGFGKGLFDKAFSQSEYDDEKEKPTYLISKVVRVIDGDTIVLESGQKIRLSIVNTPERGQLGYYEATMFTESLCLDRPVFVDIDDGQQRGSYDRLVGAVYCDYPDNSVYLNLELLRNGYANIMYQYCEKSEFAEELCI